MVRGRWSFEGGGHPTSLGLKKRDPFMTNGCKFNDTECIMRNDKDCSMMGAIYIIRCITCKERLDPEVKEDPTVPGGVKSSHYLGMTFYKIQNYKWFLVHSVQGGISVTNDYKNTILILSILQFSSKAV